MLPDQRRSSVEVRNSEVVGSASGSASKECSVACSVELGS